VFSIGFAALLSAGLKAANHLKMKNPAGFIGEQGSRNSMIC